MRTKELDFNLPKELIAQRPVTPRDSARLLVLDKKSGKIVHTNFRELVSYLKEGDVLVFNKTKVFPARISASKKTGGMVEVLFLREIKPKKWEVLIGGSVQNKQELILTGGLKASVEKHGNEKYLNISLSKKDLFNYLEKNGEIPLPPYIKRDIKKTDSSDYQTVFGTKIGSAAAPTAGLHFTKRLLDEIKKTGIEITYITLHVGLGTFQPVKTLKLEDHPIHSEVFSIDNKTASHLNNAKKSGRRIIAVGTTVTRALETAGITGIISPQTSETNLFIYPGFKFRIIDGLITNFHTPKSSLLGLVFAFGGKTKIKKAYRVAIKKRYRFFSYGDGMFIK